jgi:hypothetical protein
MTDTPDEKRWFSAALKGALIGLVGGLLSGPMILAWLLIECSLKTYSPEGGSLFFVPFLGGACLTVVGTGLGACVGAIIGASGIRLGHVRASTFFGMVLFGFIGTLWVSCICLSARPDVKHSASLLIGELIIAPLIAGAAGGALIGKAAQCPFA